MKKTKIKNSKDLPFMLKIDPHVKDLMDLSREGAYKLAHRTDFPAVRIGRSIRVPRDAFLRWLDAQAQGGVGAENPVV